VRYSLIAHLLDGSLKLLDRDMRLRGSSVGGSRGRITGQLLLQHVALRAEPASGEEGGVSVLCHARESTASTVPVVV
jgi:hypothetical protein